MNLKFSLWISYHNAQKNDPDNTSSDITEILEIVTGASQAIIYSKNIELQLPPKDNTKLNVNIHKKHLLEIFDNLFQNAIKFSEKGGKVIVNYSLKEEFFCFSISNQGYLRDLESQNIGTSGEIGTGTGIKKVIKILKIYNSKLSIKEGDGFVVVNFKIPIN